MDEDEFGETCQYHTRYLAPGPRLQEAGSPFAWPFMLDQVIHPTDCMRFFMGQVSEVYATGTVDGRIEYRFNVRESTLRERRHRHDDTWHRSDFGSDGFLSKATGNQAIQVFETRRLRRYRNPTWLGFGGGYADSPTEEWDLNTAYHGIGRPGYLEEMQHWARSLQAGTQPHSSLEDAYQNMRVLGAISRSIEIGEVVQIFSLAEVEMEKNWIEFKLIRRFCLGQPVIRGTRITVSVILKLLASGRSIEEVIEDYPELEVADVQEAMKIRLRKCVRKTEQRKLL